MLKPDSSVPDLTSSGFFCTFKCSVLLVRHRSCSSYQITSLSMPHYASLRLTIRYHTAVYHINTNGVLGFQSSAVKRDEGLNDRTGNAHALSSQESAPRKIMYSSYVRVSE